MRDYKIILTIGISIIIFGLIIGFIFLLKTQSQGYLNLGGIDFEKSAQIGSFLSGAVAPFLSLAGTIFFLGALWLQREDLVDQRQAIKAQQQNSRQQLFETYLFKNLDLFDNAIKEFIEKGIDPILNSATDEFLDKNFSYDIDFGYDCNNGEEVIYEMELQEDLEKYGTRIDELRTKKIQLSYTETFLANHFYNILEGIKKNDVSENNYEQLVFAKLPKEILRFLLYYTLFHQEDKLHLLKELRVAIPLHPLYHPSHAKLFKPETE
ncbi:hypothetical protein [Maridesulfovibrio ferrireducens]|uniref:hypothetical protein n=1 Tax=Maridesulfovibrio ferrireducens TaxID=246191 RepID=UPI001A2FB3D7|nr:hypothetical protein [Maridesulfovibrio ferrireducens]MBI9109894.1 hypothetical protein [Maridesulfovibrio ferrireducens]